MCAAELKWNGCGWWVIWREGGNINQGKSKKGRVAFLEKRISLGCWRILWRWREKSLLGL